MWAWQVIPNPSDSPSLTCTRVTWEARWNTDFWAPDSVGLGWSLQIFSSNKIPVDSDCVDLGLRVEDHCILFLFPSTQKLHISQLCSKLGFGQTTGSGPVACVCHFQMWPRNSPHAPNILPFPGEPRRLHVKDGGLPRWKAPRSVSSCMEESSLT